MHVLLVPGRFASFERSQLAALSLAEGWGDGAPHDTIDLMPLADGGPGFVDLVAADSRAGGAVHDGMTRPARGVLLRRSDSGSVTAFIDSDVGLRRGTGTFGVGEQVLAALAEGAERIVLGLGTATDTPTVPDGGAGFLTALGVQSLGGMAMSHTLGEATADSLGGLSAVAERLAPVYLVGAYAIDIGLLGLHGACAEAAKAGALSLEQAQFLEHALGHFAHTTWEVVRSDLAAPRRPALDLAAGETTGAGRARDITGLPGAGAGAGLGWLIPLLGGRLLPGAAVFAEEVGLSDRVRSADLVVTACGDLDGASFHESAAERAARAAESMGIPCIAIAERSMMNRRECAAAGLSAAYAVTEIGADVSVAQLRQTTERIARSWSPRRVA
jgi:glycerate 2-kinase